MARFFIVVFGVWLSSCMTIKPHLPGTYFYACKSLCHGNKGMEHMAMVIEINYTGHYEIIQNECTCKSSQAFNISTK